MNQLFLKLSAFKLPSIGFFSLLTLFSYASFPQEAESTVTLSSSIVDSINTDLECIAHDYSENQWRTGRKKLFNFPTIIDVEPGSELITCVQLYGMEPDETHTIELQRPQFQYRINEGEWQTHSTQSTFTNNDKIYLRTTAKNEKASSGETYLRINGGYSSFWRYQTANTERESKTWQVGPNGNYRQLGDIQSQLVAGDIIELEGDSSYHAIEFTRSGSFAAPIIIRGITVNNKRPVISGNISDEKKWTLAFTNSHNYLIENIEVTGGDGICVRNMAHQITIQDSYIHHCPNHGIIGTDLHSGTLILNRVEVSHAGNSIYRHAIYVATDGHQFPNSKLRIENSYIHDYRGNGLKSRAYRTEFISNWVEQSDWVNPENNEDHSYYSIELIGPDGYEPDTPLEQLVMDNVFVHKAQKTNRGFSTFGMRFGGDGTGYSMGKVWFSNNIVISPAEGQSAIFRTQFKLNSIYMQNNLFMRADSQARQWQALSLFNNRVDEWYSGQILIRGDNNWYPERTIISGNQSLPSQTVSQWQANNLSGLEMVSGISFNSTTGVITLPDKNVLFNNNNDSTDLLSAFKIEGLNNNPSLTFEGKLQRPTPGQL